MSTCKVRGITPSPWVVWQLSEDSDPERHCIVTTADGETEICGHVYNEADALVLATAPEMRDLLSKTQALRLVLLKQFGYVPECVLDFCNQARVVLAKAGAA